ncbi:MAG: cell division protein ZapA [Thiolinea sp.]
MDKQIIPVTVRIFSKEYPVACPEGEEDSLFASAKRVDQEMRKIRESGKVVGTDRIAVMVALNLAYDLLQLQKQQQDSGLDAQSAQHIQNIEQAIDHALNRYQQTQSGNSTTG